MIKREQGFTLLEVLLAVAILAVVSSMVGLALKSSFAVLGATALQKDVHRQARVVVQRLSEDLAAALVVPGIDFSGTSREIDGQRADSLSFASLAHLVFDPDGEQGGVAEISYLVESEEKQPERLRLLRRDHRLRPGQEGAEGSGFVLCKDLRSLSLAYVGADGQKIDTWEGGKAEEQEDETAQLPRAVFLTLEFWLDQEEEQVAVFRSAVWIPAAQNLGDGDRG
ncbi:PulJ/GspJ family protein [Desulfogranum mediterraneum]|uniref:PulJ/GspJ family protein n=1 Tax=Desulfogranum mediterraneum TaxID=160661 RepID=UPI0003FDA0FF|nr:prepilin-type N-terminal cleavage/methylation domain-containing protein [Desulfogranum mediterraneum]